MTFKEKSTRKPGGKTATDSEDYTFSEIVDKACESLIDRQIQYTIHRIREMEAQLCDLEQELDEFLKLRVRN